MNWQNPEALYFLWLVPLWIGLAFYARIRRRRAARAFVAETMHERLLPPDSPARFWLKTGLWALALVFVLLAAARPRFGVYFTQIRQRGGDLYVLLDVSRSMTARDVPPSRLQRAKEDIKVLANKLEGTRMGLIAFAGRPVVQCPLTSDSGFFRLALDDVDTDSAPRGGTAIGDAIRKALEVLPKDGSRDQALLLITDGGDQDSYPMEAAKAAEERNIPVFAVGIGDPEEGAPVPGKTAGSVMTYQGQEVRSRLDESLLREIALTTRGAYVPFGVRGYDFEDLADRIHKMQGEEANEQKRKRMREQYQIFLGLGLIFFVLEMFVRRYPRRARSEGSAPVRKASLAGAGVVLAMLLGSGGVQAGEAGPSASGKTGPPDAGTEAQGKDRKKEDVTTGDPVVLVREGLEAYASADYAGARRKFMGADVSRPETPEIAFDLACAYQKEGDAERAAEQYQKASLSRDRRIASAARYNLGCLDADAAKALAGSDPAQLAPGKREEVLKHLATAVANYRQCLAYDKNHGEARRNLERIRLWIKYYTELWRKQEQEKHRKDMDLVQFLDYLMKTEDGLRAQSDAAAADSQTTVDRFAELKRAQDALLEEIPTLNAKVEELKAQAQGGPPGQQGSAPTKEQTEHLEQAIAQFLKWSAEAGKQMGLAAEKLGLHDPTSASQAQEQASSNLESIWEVLAPAGPIVARALERQTRVVEAVKPQAADGSASPDPAMATPTARVLKEQENAQRPAALIVPKAKEMLKMLETMPDTAQADPKNGTQPPVPKQEQDPKKAKEGLEKAIDLAPKAMKHQSASAKHLSADRRGAAHPEAEEARKILEEIAKNLPQDQQQQQGDQQNQQDKKEEDQKKDDKKQDQNKGDNQSSQKKDQDKQDKKDGGQENQDKREMTEEEIEALMRKAREHEKERRKAQEELKARMGQPAPVEKDW